MAARARDGRLDAHPGADVTQRGVAVASVLMIGLNVQIKYGATLGLVPVVLLLPVWAHRLGAYRWSRVLMVVAGAAVLWGTLLARFAAQDHIVNKHQALTGALMIITAFGAIGVLLWAHETLRADSVVILFGIGLGGSHLLDHAGWAANPWKYGFALPVAMIVVAVGGRIGPATGVLALAAVGLVSLVSDYRSFAAFCVITILVVVWQQASRSTRARVNKAAPLIMLGAVGLSVYIILSNLLVQGYLGSGLQARSTAQIEASGSLLIGGRPEWAATSELMAHRPQGYGLGVQPNTDDVLRGDAGLASVNIDPANGYELYMFGDGFRLHSLLADLWTAAGWGGLLLSATVLVILLVRLSTALADRTATPILVFATVFAIWALAFSPIFTDLKDVTFAAFLAFCSQPKRVPPPAHLGHHRLSPLMKIR